MERSTKFISLSGLSGIMAGLYALAGAGLGYDIIYGKGILRGGYTIDIQLFAIALIVLLLSVTTGIVLTARKAHRKSQTVWNQSSKALLKNGVLPLLAGGCFILILFSQDNYSIIGPACLIFYGLALAAASQYTYGDVKWLGITEIILGLLAMMLPGYDLLFWALGFGVMHILYGSIMYFKYDRENNAD